MVWSLKDSGELTVELIPKDEPRRTFEVEKIANSKAQNLEWTWKGLVFSFLFRAVERI